MNEINENTCFSLHPDITYTLIDDEAVVMGIMDDALYGMNNVATEILKRLESNQIISLQTLTAYLSQHFLVDSAECMKDTKAFLQSMLAKNLIIQAG